jgi:hypothetical protein
VAGPAAVAATLAVEAAVAMPAAAAAVAMPAAVAVVAIWGLYKSNRSPQLYCRSVVSLPVARQSRARRWQYLWPPSAAWPLVRLLRRSAKGAP